jgi:protein TonB
MTARPAADDVSRLAGSLRAVRSLAVVLALLGASAIVHVAILLVTRAGGLILSPPAPRCQAGETVRLRVSLRLGATTSRLDRNVSFSVRGNALRSLGGGLFSCLEAGSAEIEARWDGRRATASVEIDPPVIALDLPKEPPPPPPPLSHPPRVRQPAPPKSVPDPPPPEPRPPEPPRPEAAHAAEIMTTETPNDPRQRDAIVTQAGPGASGSGVVAARGTASIGAPGAVAGGKIGGTGIGAGAGGPDLSRAPTIIDPDPCRGFFPDAAEDDSALVDIDVAVDGDGRVRTASVLGESPPGQGFGSAARRCFSSMRVRPALDRAGREVAGRMRLRFRFTR